MTPVSVPILDREISLNKPQTETKLLLFDYDPFISLFFYDKKK